MSGVDEPIGLEDEETVSELLAEASIMDSNYELAIKMFDNSIIWEKLSGYLDLGDLKSLRMTNHFFRDQVTHSRRFKERVILHMTKGALKDQDFAAFLDEYPEWISIAVTLFETKEVDVDLMAKYHPSILNGEVKQLRFYWKRGEKTPAPGAEAQFIFGVLKNVPQLTRLEIKSSILSQVDISYADAQIQELLRNIKDFRLLSISDTHASDSSRNSFHMQRIKQEKNFGFLKTVLTHLKSLHIEYPLSEDAHGLSIIENNSNTLESLVVSDSKVWNETDIGQIVCPFLKEISARCSNTDLFKEFLKNQPPLEKISISVNGKLDAEVLEIISKKHIKNLKTLHIKSKGLKLKTLGSEVSSFNFLKLTCLKDFSLVVPQYPENDGFYGDESCYKILTCLPQSIQIIKLRGIFFNPTTDVRELVFPQLTELSIIDYKYESSDELGGFVNDILTKNQIDGKLPFPNLTTLELLKCKELSGKKFINMNDLKGLKKLRISYSCLTDDDILSINLPKLKMLDISGNHSLSSGAIQKMMCQNPRLEVLRCSQYGIQKEGRLKKVVYHEVEDSANPEDSDSDAEIEHVEDVYDDDDDENIYAFDSYEDYPDECYGHHYDFNGHCCNCGDLDFAYDGQCH